MGLGERSAATHAEFILSCLVKQASRVYRKRECAAGMDVDRDVRELEGQYLEGVG